MERAARSKALVLGFLLAALMTVSLLLTARPAHAADFVVTNTNDSGAGSLRQAILDANANRGKDTVNFNIPEDDPGRDPATGVFTIALDSALPIITEPVTIDGYTQPGARPNTLEQGNDAVLLVELDGTNTGGLATGLFMNANDSVVKGLVINRFSRGIAIDRIGGAGTADNNRIEGNFIGTDASGTQDLGNSSQGISITAATNNTIGGTDPAARNVVSGNGNFFLSCGICLGFEATDNEVLGNHVGITKDGSGPLGNVGSGVLVGASDNTIGGEASGAANTIAFNDGEGIKVVNDGSAGNRILSNSIFDNVQLGIDLEDDGVTPNDEDDPDAGVNGLQNFPVLASARRGSLTVNGSLNSTPGTAFRIEFFANDECDSSGNGEGKTFVGSTDVTTDAGGDASLDETFPANLSGGFVTATATNRATNDTSEFSECRQITDNAQQLPPPKAKKKAKKKGKGHKRGKKGKGSGGKGGGNAVSQNF